MNKCLTALSLAAFAATALWGASEPGITFVGRGEIPGNQADKSGLPGIICQLGNPANCIPNTTLGGLGSALTYTGFDDVFIAVPDRGPFDGRTDIPYFDRFHFLKLILDTTQNPNTGVLNITPTVLDTRLLKADGNQNFLGSSAAFDTANPAASLRFDPEGVVVTSSGTFIISDEYGPYIYEFNTQGNLVRRIPVPPKFLIDHPTGNVNNNGDSLELYKFPFSVAGIDYGNNSGRQANRGMEGLAITPDGRYLVGLMQNALIQDNGLSYPNPQTLTSSPGRVSLNNRILKYDLLTGQSWEYVYVMDAINQGKGTNEILAINDHQFLVLERDNRSLKSPGADAFSPASSGLKRIYKIDLNTPGPTDISGHAVLPASFTPVSKALFIDLLNPAYEVDAVTHATIKSLIAEKIEGLAWGPDLPNGHHILYVISDNDLNTTFPTQIFAFEVDPAAASITLARQYTPGPMYPDSDQLITGVSPSTLQRSTFSGFAGMQVAIGASPLRVTSLGRMCTEGNSKIHTLKLVSANTKLDVAGGSTAVSMAGCVPGQFVYASLASPLTLTPLANYYLVSEELSGGDEWLDVGPVTLSPGASSVGAVYFNGTNWIVSGPAGTSYVPPSMQFEVLSAPPAAAFVLSYNLDNRVLRNNFTGFVGMRLRTGAAEINVTSVGRACVPGNSQTHIVKFVNASTGADVPGASASVNMAGCATDFVYTDLASPVVLAASTTYYLVSQETGGGDRWFDQSKLATRLDANVLSSIFSLNSGYATNEANASYVVPNFLYTK